MSQTSTVVITSIYKEFWGTKQFRKSCDRVGLPVVNAFRGEKFTGNGDVITNIYETLLSLENHFKYAIYADGADSLFLRSFTPPPGCILYSAEKAIWPPTTEMYQAWNKYYDGISLGELNGFTNPFTRVRSTSPWKYLNGGGYCGEIGLLIKFFERYGLNKLKGDINGQDKQALAFLEAQQEGFPIFLDTECDYFQTTGHAHVDDFVADKSGFRNRITNGLPAILHGNGRTDMTHLYNLYNNEK